MSPRWGLGVWGFGIPIYMSPRWGFRFALDMLRYIHCAPMERGYRIYQHSYRHIPLLERNQDETERRSAFPTNAVGQDARPTGADGPLGLNAPMNQPCFVHFSIGRHDGQAKRNCFIDCLNRLCYTALLALHLIGSCKRKA